MNEEIQRLNEKYTNEADPDFDLILESILLKDKYLMLAYQLEQNRMDWNQGYEYASVGIDNFVVESKDDIEIYEEINQVIDHGNEHGEIDGRAFRDCEWNYSVIYKMVEDEELLKDFKQLLKYEH